MTHAWRTRWQGQVPAARLLWPEMLLWGTLINLGASALALVWWSQGGPPAAVLALHLLPVLPSAAWTACVWRQAQARPMQRALALVWLALMLWV